MNYTPEQQRANRKLWTAWLRANPDKQGVGSLLSNGKCCGVGAGCIVAVDNGAPIRVFEDESGDTLFDGHSSIAPIAFKGWSGLSTHVAMYTGDDGVIKSLVQDNDNGKTFAEIADIIDSEPEGLFLS